MGGSCPSKEGRQAPGELAADWSGAKGVSTRPAGSRGLFSPRTPDPPSTLGPGNAPVAHQETPALEQVRADKGRLHPVPDHMRVGRLDHLPEVVGFLTRRVPEGQAEPVRQGREMAD